MDLDSAKVEKINRGEQPLYCGSAADCARKADVLILATPWKEFSEMDDSVWRGKTRRPVILDAWRIAPASWRKNTVYLPVGGYTEAQGKKRGRGK